MLDERYVQIAVADPALTKLLRERGWDGVLAPPAQGDFLAVIDTNVGFNKANAAVKQQISYQVARDGDNLNATLTITYTHTARPLPANAACERSLKYGDSYQELAARCYWDYLRVYAPQGSELAAAQELQHSQTAPGENNLTVFSGDFVLRPGAKAVVTLRYRLPRTLSPALYALTVRKQAGTVALPLRVQTDTCVWQTDLRQDRAFACPARP
jgi:hypothetical protein